MSGLRKRTLRGAVLALAVLLTLGGCGQQENAGAAETELGEGQRLARLQVISITGNELTYVEQESEEETEPFSESGTDRAAAESETAPDIESETASGAESEPASDAEEETGESAGTEANSENGWGSSGGFREKGEAPEGFEQDRSGFPGGELPDDMPDMEGFSGGSVSFGGTGREQNTVTVYIPVGTVVHTDTGEERTFSILEAGDELEVLLETNADGEEVITEIWIQG